MKYLLDKDSVILLEKIKQRHLINEKAVPWNKSALGILSNAVLRPISWLTGSIKKGINGQQINTLIQQWGMEYVNAIKRFDMPEKENSDETNNNSTEEDLKDLDIEQLKRDFAIVKLQKPILQKIAKLKPLDAKNQEFIDIKSELVTNHNKVDLIKFTRSISNMNISTLPDKLEENVTNFNDFITKFETSADVMQFINNCGGINKVYELLKTNIQRLDNIEDSYDIVINSLETSEDGDSEETNESLIFEASQYELPKNIKDLFPETSLEILKQIPDIKTKITDKINTQRLDTIKYEAEFIINKVKSSKNDNSAELQRKWDIGIKNINDYFQEVIDTPKIMKSVTGDVDSGIKATIEQDQSKLTELQNMSITELFAVGQSFESNKLYAIDAEIIGNNGKKNKGVYLISPVNKYTVNVEGDNYFFFKIYGQYKWDKNNKTVERINFFKNITSAKSMISNFENDGNAYIMAFRNLRPGNKSNDAFIYSNTGKVFFNNAVVDGKQLITDLDQFKGKDLAESIKNISKIGNTLKVLINQRFIIEDQPINENKYPGISKDSIIDDSGSKSAKSNHEIIIKTLS